MLLEALFRHSALECCWQLFLALLVSRVDGYLPVLECLTFSAGPLAKHTSLASREDACLVHVSLSQASELLFDLSRLAFSIGALPNCVVRCVLLETCSALCWLRFACLLSSQWISLRSFWLCGFRFPQSILGFAFSFAFIWASFRFPQFSLFGLRFSFGFAFNFQLRLSGLTFGSLKFRLMGSLRSHVVRLRLLSPWPQRAQAWRSAPGCMYVR